MAIIEDADSKAKSGPAEEPGSDSTLLARVGKAGGPDPRGEAKDDPGSAPGGKAGTHPTILQTVASEQAPGEDGDRFEEGVEGIQDGGGGPTGGPGDGLIAPGSTVDHFQVRRLLGKGGMGEVYLARDTQLGRRVALKVILPDALENETAVKRFMREAQITARFSHPHIVTIYSVGTYEGCPYLALEYLPGQNLRDRLEEERPGQKEALRIALAVAEAVAEAHRHGVLHRDLKPGNVLVPRDGRIRVLDFGLSRTTQLSERALHDRSLMGGDISRLEGPSKADGHDVFQTAGKGLRGTPAYMAPEQWREETEVEATDVWALGLILYELLAGRHPYEGLTFFNICLSVCSEEPVPTVGQHTLNASPELVELVDRCLHKNPKERPRAQEVVEALSALVAGTSARTGTSEHNPFLGLMPFSERHADRFFGREAEIASFLERLREVPLLPVVGPSGAGKSSFMQAGVIPRLREQGPWIVLRMRPGRRPFETLASRLLSGDSLDRVDSRGSVGSRNGLSASALGRRREERSRRDSTVGADASESALGGTASPVTASGGPVPRQASSRTMSALGDTDDHPLGRLGRELEQSPARLSLYLNQMVDQQGARVLLFVDQLEELFTLVPSDDTRQAFLEMLCWAADDPDSGVRVVFTLRDDFLGRLASSVGASDALGRVMLLGTPGPEALTEILRRPVTTTGYQYEDDALVAEMVQAVEGEPAALPLLQFAGQVLWEHRNRSSRRLTREAYVSAGGVAGALAKHADGVLDGMPPEQEQIARQIFLRLVTPEGSRQVAPRSELLEGLGPLGKQVLERLTTERAVMVRKGFSEAEFELVHESLIKKWTRLSRWLDDSREERVFLSEVGQAAALWEKRDRLEEEVWQGEPLREALRRAARCRTLPAPVAEFLSAGERREARRLRRRRAAFAAGAVLLVAIAAASLVVSWAFRRKEQLAQRSERAAQQSAREARRQRQQAVQRQSEAQREGARAALLRGALMEARAKLRGSLQARDSDMARALWWRMRKNPLQFTKELGGVVFSVAVAPSADRIAVGCQDRAVYLFDVRTGAARVLRGHEDQVLSVAFSPDGRQLASGSWDGVIRLWDIEAAHAQEGNSARIGVRVLHGHRAGVRSIAFSPDGRNLATGGMDKTVRLWKVGSGEGFATLMGHTAEVLSVQFSPDGERLATGSGDGSVRLWNALSGECLATLKGHAGLVWGVAFHPDGKVLASAGLDDAVRLWGVPSGQPEGVLQGHGNGLTALTFRPDGKILSSGGRDGTVHHWRWKERTLEAEFAAHEKTITALSYGRQGRLLATGGYDRSMRLWESSTAPPRPTVGGHREAVVAVDFDPTGRLLATGSYDREIRLWRVDSGRVIRVLTGHRSAVYSVRFSPDGEQLASASTDGTIRIWRPSTGQSAGVLRGHDGEVTDVCFLPDGRHLVSSSFDKTARVWDATTQKTVSVLGGHAGPLVSVACHPTQGLAATGHQDGSVRIWDTKTWTLQRTLVGHESPVTGLDFHPRDRLLVSGGRDQTVRLWDLQRSTSRVLGRGLGRVFRVAFGAQGSRVGASSSDGSARVWDLASDKVSVIRGHVGEVNSVRFSPDGRLLATGGDDATVRTWRVDSGRPLWQTKLLEDDTGTLITHEGRVTMDGTLDPGPGRAAWQKALDKGARSAAVSQDGSVGCFGTTSDELEVWDRRADRIMKSSSMPGLERVRTWSAGCVALSRSDPAARERWAVRFLGPKGEPKLLVEGALAVAVDRGDLMVATANEVQIYSGPDTKTETYPATTGVTAVGRVGEWVVLGFGDGNLELVPIRKGVKVPRFSFDGVPSSRVTRIVPGPMGTLVAGFANGMVGLWTVTNGTLLEQEMLHGPIRYLMIRGRHLRAASALGQHLNWDLGVFHQSYCELLDTLWKRVPVSWEQGLPRLSPPPRDHPCLTGRGSGRDAHR